MRNSRLMGSFVFSAVVVSLWIVSRGMSKGIYGFFAASDCSDQLRSNLIWPPIVGWPLYSACNHHLWEPVVLLCLVWAFGVPLLVAAGVTKMAYAIRDNNCPRLKRLACIALIALFVVSLFIYVHIPESLWHCGYWWLSY